MSTLRVSENIVPLSEFKAHAAVWLKKLAGTGGPVVITQNGRAAAVLMSPAEFDHLTERARFAAAIREGLADADAGRVVSHAAMVAETAARYGSAGEGADHDDNSP